MADPIDLLLLNQKKKKNYGPPDPWMVARGLAPPSGPGAGGFNPVGSPTGAAGTGGTTSRTVTNTPDYKALLAGDPILGQFKSDLSASGIADAAQRDAFLTRTLAQFGTPLNLDSLNQAQRQAFSGVDPSAIATGNELAQKNTEAGLSIAARIQQAYEDSKRQELNALGARGAHRSGELGFALDRQNLAFRQAQTDAAQQFMDLVAEANAAFARGEAERARALAQQAEAAATRLLQQYPTTTETVTSGGGGGGGAPPDTIAERVAPSAPPPPPPAPPPAPAFSVPGASESEAMRLANALRAAGQFGRRSPASGDVRYRLGLR